MSHRKKIVILTICLLGMAMIAMYALYYPDSFYDNISWTWYYSAPYTSSYNCLGYATGSMTWEWPWGYYNPTTSQVNSYLAGKGYSTSGSWPRIISYGSYYSITHFSKVTGTSWCRAKWGGLERFNHGSWDPYYASSIYGPKVKQYY
jgi:hypothetical protein